MSAISYTSIIVNTQNQVDAFTQSFTFKGYEALAAYLKIPLGSLCVLYIILMGYALLLGYVKTPIDVFKKIVLRLGLIYMFAMNWGTFAQYFVGLFIDTASEMGGVIMQANPGNITGNGVNGALQNVLTEVIRVGQDIFNQANLRHWSPAFTAIMIDLAGVLVVAIAFFELMIAKIMLSVCLCFAPLFFIFTLFDQTRTFFDRWLGTLVGFALVFIFVSAIVGLCMHLLHTVLELPASTHGDKAYFALWIPVTLMAILGIMALFEAAHIGKSIGGACSTSHGSTMVGAFIGGALGASQTAGKGASWMRNSFSSGGNFMKSAAATSFNAMKSIQNKIRGSK